MVEIISSDNRTPVPKAISEKWELTAAHQKNISLFAAQRSLLPYS